MSRASSRLYLVLFKILLTNSNNCREEKKKSVYVCIKLLYKPILFLIYKEVEFYKILELVYIRPCFKSNLKFDDGRHNNVYN